MTARIIEIELSDSLNREGWMFHCPLTGTPIAGDRDQAFEQFQTPYFLFCIGQDGEVLSRSDELPEPVGSDLKKAIASLQEAGHPGRDGLVTHELHTFVPNVLADMLADSTVIFDIGLAGEHQRSSARMWLAMDFMLPAKTVGSSCIDHSAQINPVE